MDKIKLVFDAPYRTGKRTDKSVKSLKEKLLMDYSKSIDRVFRMSDVCKHAENASSEIYKIKASDVIKAVKRISKK